MTVRMTIMKQARRSDNEPGRAMPVLMHTHGKNVRDKMALQE